MNAISNAVSKHTPNQNALDEAAIGIQGDVDRDEMCRDFLIYTFGFYPDEAIGRKIRIETLTFDILTERLELCSKLQLKSAIRKAKQDADFREGWQAVPANSTKEEHAEAIANWIEAAILEEEAEE